MGRALGFQVEVHMSHDAMVEAVVTISDAELFRWLKTFWTGAGLRLEPSAASGFTAIRQFLADARPADEAAATYVVWTTEGSSPGR